MPPIRVGLPGDDVSYPIKDAGGLNDVGTQFCNPATFDRCNDERRSTGNRINERELSDVVQQGRILQLKQVVLGETELAADRDRKLTDPLRVTFLDVAADFGDPRERADGLAVGRTNRRVPPECELGQQQWDAENRQGIKLHGRRGQRGQYTCLLYTSP